MSSTELGCSGVMLEAAASGSFIGAALGGGLSAGQFLALKKSGKLPPHSASAVRTVGAQAARSGVGFGLFLATFNGGMCLMEAARGGQRDAANAAVAGGLAGFCGALPRFLRLSSSNPDPNALLAFRNPRFLAAQTLGTAVLGALVFTLLPSPPSQGMGNGGDDDQHFALPMLSPRPEDDNGGGGSNGGGSGAAEADAGCVSRVGGEWGNGPFGGGGEFAAEAAVSLAPGDTAAGSSN